MKTIKLSNLNPGSTRRNLVVLGCADAFFGAFKIVSKVSLRVTTTPTMSLASIPQGLMAQWHLTP